MRRLVLIVIVFAVVVLGVGLFMSGRRQPTQVQVSPSRADLKTVIIPVEGMVCLACTAKVKSTLKAINGVAEVEVNLAGRVARVEYREGKVSAEELVSAINRLGYRAGPPKAEDRK